MQQNGTEVANAYRCCWRIATSHYENFTVGSWLLPRRLRRHIAAIYAFARTADDMADEGHAPATERLAKLREHEAALDACYRGTATTPIFIALADTVSRFEIPSAPFRRLLAAFRTDVEFKPFADFDALREYCRCSADPVGHLVLYLFGYRDAQRQALADNICTGLQLANFWQDVRVDGAKGRVYVPRTDLERFGCTADDLLNGRDSEATRALISFEVDRARSLLCAGLPLVDLVDRRLGREVRLFAEGGLTILDLIEAQRFDVFTARPVVSKAMKARMVLRAFGGLPRPSHNPVIAPPIESGRDASVPAVAHSSEARLHSDYEYCQEITRRSSSNFYYAFQLLSPERRSALYAVYAFCRFVDDVADDEGRREPEKLLERWREELVAVYAGTPGHAISRALADSVRRFPLDQRHFLDLIQGVETDLTRRRYDTFDDLYRYCYLVASTVGLLCIEI
ncbi:MAG TPA: squalene synthase HpnC, partial [Candidatus Acidoferrales bacterium]|nr:squalene synthase HpnC [Candidatus Acidoferrales bacterium]